MDERGSDAPQNTPGPREGMRGCSNGDSKGAPEGHAFVMTENERKTSQKLIERASDAMASISLEEIVNALHRRFGFQWEWNAFKAQLKASEHELTGTKDKP